MDNCMTTQAERPGTPMPTARKTPGHRSNIAPAASRASIGGMALSAIAGAMLLAAPALQAQSFPVKSVRLVHTFPPGGPVDFVTRGAAEELSRLWGQPVIVDPAPRRRRFDRQRDRAHLAPGRLHPAHRHPLGHGRRPAADPCGEIPSR
jgi:hypothetical protein